MKKILFSFLFFNSCFQISNAQNIGIGNTNPQAVLDVQGDIRFRSVNITLAAGFSGELNASATKASVYNVSSVATITGISGGVDGRLITLVNTGAVNLVRIKLLDENDPLSTSVAGNKTILGNTFFINQKGSVVFRYDGSLQRWSVVSKNGVNDGTVALWQQAGNDLYNSNTGNVGIGNNSPVAKLDVAGNIKITDGTQGEGKVLTSDANGVGTWQSISLTPASSLYTFQSRTFTYAPSSGNPSATYTIPFSNSQSLLDVAVIQISYTVNVYPNTWVSIGPYNDGFYKFNVTARSFISGSNLLNIVSISNLDGSVYTGLPITFSSAKIYITIPTSNVILN